MADTIAAVATGTGISAIAIVRVSGDGAIDAADAIFRPKSGKSIKDARNRSLVYGDLYDADGNVIDICLCTVSRAPNSYTGENTVEFQCHGSPVVTAEALRSLFAHGVRQALAGEFSRRAFLNGRMDLTQAEAVIDLIDSQTALAAKNAAGQLGRAIGRRADAIYDSIIDILSHFQAVLDYPDEDIPEFEMDEYVSVFKNGARDLRRLLATFDRGRLITDGVKCAIIGRPNTGKSSLLNALLGFDRAIVTDIAGTTRDTIEERVKVGGIILRLADTAGIRQTDDVVEKLGVERALSASDGADLVIAVTDGSRPLTGEDVFVLETAAKAPHAIAVINKTDLPRTVFADDVKKYVSDAVEISALSGAGLEYLEALIAAAFPEPEDTAAGEILTNARQADAVRRAAESFDSAIEAMEAQLTPDIVLTEAEYALSALGELTGRTVRQDVVDRIFERFCVGK